jgi:hypothetical protein
LQQPNVFMTEKKREKHGNYFAPSVSQLLSIIPDRNITQRRGHYNN